MKPLYKFSFDEAARNNEKEEFWESLRENIRCRDFLDHEIAEKFDGMRLPKECAQNAVKEFGFDRTMWVIANTILERKGDGRFSRENRDWAMSFTTLKTDSNSEFVLNEHSSVVDGLANQVKKMYAELGLFSKKHIVQTNEPQDYTGKLLILRDTSLKEGYRTPENQLFLASGGFGCDPNKNGRKVMGQFLSDGEKAQFYREDFIGVIADEHIPDWAREKLEQLDASKDSEDEDMDFEP